MLIRRPALEGIRRGEVDLAFRRWKQPRVRPGTRLRTAIGLVEVGTVERVDPAGVSDAEAVRAGLASADALRAFLDRHGEGEVFRIELAYAGPDPRVALRERADLDEAELSELTARLERLDRASRSGPWTREVLELIAARPATLAADLAASLGRERDPFKRDVRKLKELGLTESLEVGYRLSPRGRAYLRSSGRH